MKLFLCLSFLLFTSIWTMNLIQHKIVFYRSSHQKCSMKKGALINFTKFTGKHLCQGVFFLTKLQAWEGCNVIKKETLAQHSGAFLWILRNVYEHVISKHLWTTVSNFICSVFFYIFHYQKFSPRRKSLRATKVD